MNPTSGQTGEAADRKATLLNLLKFTAAGSTPSQVPNAASSLPSGPENYSRTSSVLAGALSSPFAPSGNNSFAAGTNPQEQLLKLLNRATPQQADVLNGSAAVPRSTDTVTSPGPIQPPSAASLNVKSEPESKAATPSAQPHRPPSTIFNFVSPFDRLSVDNGAPNFGSDANDSLSTALATPSTGDATNGRKTLAPKSPVPKLPDGRTQVEALLGIGARRSESTSVPKALSNVADETDKQAKDALERALKQEKVDIPEIPEQITMEEFSQTVKEVAKEIKQELQEANGETPLESALPPSLAADLRQAVDEIAKDGAADSWESADSDTATVRIYDFPMRPFVSIQLDGDKCQANPIREDRYSKVSSFKKEFDQQDRVLTSATPTHIIYASTKGGGYRVIQQEDGSNKQIFKRGDNPIYNISTVPLKDEGYEPILATSTNGSVYYSETPLGGEGALQQDLDKFGFVFPPLSSQEDISSTTQLKTRAKLSTCSPNYFAIARGKSIHLVWPKVARLPAYLDEKSRIVNSEKYLKERCQKIGTGKASKDFAFSVDDTALASVDKTGRLKFWDIREHTDNVYANTYEPLKVPPVEAKTPLMMLQATSERAGTSPTSIMFVDKDRTFTKKIAQRYMLVGLRQNHTLQLWDLQLSKAVQELNFPHAKDDDAFCSLAYHPALSMIIIGHPTRNSVFYISLSAPKYMLKPMSQVDYIIRCAQGGGELPKLDSTAIMTSIRETSINAIGSLRSLDIMAMKDDEESDTVFELYLMHSRGVSYVTVKPEDLGLNKERKVIESLDGEKEGAVIVSELPQVVEPAAAESATDAAPAPADPLPAPVQQIIDRLPAPSASESTSNGQADKKSKKKKRQAEEALQAAASKINSRPVSPPAFAAVGNGPDNAAPEMKEISHAKPQALEDSATLTEIGKPEAELTPQLPDSQQALPQVTERSINELSTTFNDQFEALYKRLDDDKRVWEASSAANQDAVLRLVSKTLTDNVEKSLARIVNASVEKSMGNLASTLEQKMSATISQKLNTTLTKELTKVASKIETDISKKMQDQVVQVIREDALVGVQKATQTMESAVKGHLHEHNIARQADAAKIDDLVSIVQGLTTSHSLLEQKIAQFEEILKSQAASAPIAPPQPMEPPKPKTEVEILADMVAEGRHEEAIMKWLQSPNHGELFDTLFHAVDPEQIEHVSPLVSLSVIPDVSASFGTHTDARLNWLDTVLTVIDINDTDTAVHAGNIMGILIQRLQSLYFQVMESGVNHSLLTRVLSVMRAARDLAKRAQPQV